MDGSVPPYPELRIDGFNGGEYNVCCLIAGASLDVSSHPRLPGYCVHLHGLEGSDEDPVIYLPSLLHALAIVNAINHVCMHMREPCPSQTPSDDSPSDPARPPTVPSEGR